MIRNTLLIVVLALVCFCQVACGTPNQPNEPAATGEQTPAVEVEPGPKVPVELWVMAQCPFGTGAEFALNKVENILGSRMDISIRFILDAVDGGKAFDSLHGPKEVELDMAQVCAGMQKPDKLIDYIVAFNTSEDDWKQTAQKMGYDVADLEKCMNDGRGRDALVKDAEESKKRQITGSPTLFIGGKPYEGARGSLDLFEAICKKFDNGSRPAVCDTKPASLSRTDGASGSGKCGGEGDGPAVPDELVAKLKLEHTVIYDSKAFSSNMDMVLEQTKKFFPNAEINKVDYQTPEGKKLVAEYGIDMLPAYVFPESVKDAKNFAQLRAALVETKDGHHYMLNPRQVASNVNISRPRIAGQVKIFYSPISEKALTILLDINDLLKQDKYKKAAANIQYLPAAMVDRTGELRAQGGIGEIEEMERQSAILQTAPDKFFKYIELRREKPTSSYWQDFLKQVGLDPEAIRKKAQSSEIHAKLLTDGKEMEAIGANPTFSVLVENRELAQIRDKEDFRRLLDDVILK